MPDVFLHGVETTEISDGVRSIRTVKSSVVGLVGTAPDADVAIFPADTPVLVTGPRMAASLGDAGTLKDAYLAAYAQGISTLVVVRADFDGEDPQDATAIAAVRGDATEQTGIYALLLSGAMTGQVPRILAAPGYTDGDARADLLVVAPRLRAIVVADGPNTTEAAALADAAAEGSDRLYIVDPHVVAYDPDEAMDVTMPASGFVAGLISKVDQTKGFWWSPSNQLLASITGTARPVSFALNSAETEANRLNEGNVTTIVNRSGWRLWGNRTPTADSLWTFLPVRRTADMIYESIEQAMLWAMDRPFSAQLLRDIQGSVEAYLRTLEARGAILGSAVWLDPELNSETELKAGKLYVNFDIEPPAPLEHLHFQAYRNGSYYEELIAQVANA